MTASPVEAEGVQPAFIYRPPRARSLLPKVLAVCKTVGREHEPEQALAVDVLTGMKADGSPASLEGAVISARQNLKTYILENIVLTKMLDPSDPARLFIWTAQQLNTCQETFFHFLALVDNPDYPHLKRRIKKITYGNGSEQIETHDGRRLRFSARSEKSGRGLTGDVLVLDEAFALEPGHLAALLPTLSTRRRATVYYGSSAGHAGSEVLRGVRDRGREGGKGAPAYIEFCAPGSMAEPGCRYANCRHTPDMEGCVLDREDLVQLANPMAGRRIGWEFLRNERLSMPPLEYARERLGWWDEPDDGAVCPISVAAWRGRADDDSEIRADGSVVLSAEIALDRRSASIAVAGWRVDQAAHVGLIAHNNGTDWLLPRLLELATKHRLHDIYRADRSMPAVIIDPTSPAGDLAEPLRRAGIEPVLLTAREVATACGGLQDAITGGQVYHRGQPAVDIALAGAIRRDLGDGGWAFGRKKSAAVSVDITPAVAVANAHWGLMVAEPEYDPAETGFY